MNKLTRIRCEADAYDFPYIAELLEEYDRLVEAIGRVSRLVQDSVHPRHGAGGCGIYARELQAAIAGLTPESEREKVMEELVRESERLGLYTWTDKQVDNRTPLGSHAADLECLRATQEENDRLDRKLKAAELDANFNGEEVERLREELALALEWKEREQRENIRLNIALADSEKKIEELKKAGKVLVTRDTKVTIAAERIEEENKRLQSKIRTVQMELKEDGEMQDKLDQAFLEIERLETELRFHDNEFVEECRKLEAQVELLKDEAKWSTAREVSLAEAANAAEKKCFLLEKRRDLLQAERDEYRMRARWAESRLSAISESIAHHLDEKALRSTQE